MLPAAQGEGGHRPPSGDSCKGRPRTIIASGELKGMGVRVDQSAVLHACHISFIYKHTNTFSNDDLNTHTLIHTFQ